ncbi:hypothetical protein DICPUDRAFT_79738 [Dictyostelium purpureum]|uniref:Translin-associated protein X n=1 Tax=Dictyostelium purpureum TaxID=5786 RepID=F0ZNG8_DICPU|nr:uncharacterized protein DICPUDRAFT_79738 [Dictyostelium purpureum]EGC34512.1 hypothetical protein DICPUDRAFT_79738 [Dictyostelium purpureum]|eukprot:XP_003288948.1 hypothetical protein DICPUDRAFT_79738 [Dictyostelium purpureum]
MKRDGEEKTPIEKSEDNKRFKGQNNNNFRGRNNNNNNQQNKNEEKDLVFNDPEIKTLFSAYSKKLDEDNDRRERIVKSSRDITIQSKRVISLLQRAVWEDKNEIIKQSKQNLQPIYKLFEVIIKELDQQEYYKFQRAFSMGIQEFVEAVSFQYYLEHSSLISVDEIINPMKESLGLESLGQFSISLEDYALGICDLSGELMRYATNLCTKQKIDECFNICSFVREMSNGFKKCHLNRDISSKMNTMEDSLKKIEKLCFSIRVRKSEFPNVDILLGSDSMNEPMNIEN